MPNFEQFPEEKEEILAASENSEDYEKLEERAEFILKRLGLEWEDLKGKKVLDIGASTAELEKVAKDHGVDIIAYDFDPYNVRLNKKLDIESKTPPWSQDIEYVQGAAEGLPFKDESFDFIISHGAPPTVGVSNKTEIRSVVDEAMRVLKKGGEFRFGSVGMMAHVFEEKELFTDKEAEEFSGEERIQRVQEKSSELFQNIDANITEHKGEEESFYSLIK